MALLPEAVPSLCRDLDFTSPMSPDCVQVGPVDIAADPCSAQLQSDIDEFLSLIDNNAQHLLPSSLRGGGDQPPMVVEKPIPRTNALQRHDNAPVAQSFDSLWGESDCVEKPRKKQRTVSHATCVSPPLAAEVDICDDEILQ